MNLIIRRYNTAQIKTRNTVERAFGIWKRRFPCLDMKLQHHPDNAITIITACAALHNLGRKLSDPCPPCQTQSSNLVPRVPPRQCSLPPPPPPPRNTNNGLHARNQLVADYFS